MKYFYVILLLFPLSLHAKLLDKVAGVINDKVITLSEISRIKQTMDSRKEIAPFIYSKGNYTNNEILSLLERNFIIKDHLSTLGFIISDDAVDSRIKELESSKGLTRRDLHAFLKSKGLNFNEYFEILREVMEYNIFNSRIIAPLVTITDQELKNYYLQHYNSSKSATFRYKIVDFYIDSKKVPQRDYQNYVKSLNEYRVSGNIPSIYSSIQSNNLGVVSEEDLPKNIRNILSRAEVNAFSQPIKLNNQLHIFYVLNKDIVDSSDFLNRKMEIYNTLFLQRSQKIINTWFSKESLNYYIVNNI